MPVSYRWLQDFVDLPEGPDETLRRLTAAGVPAEGVRRVGEGISQVVVGHLLEVGRHPNADRLSLTKVSDGKSVLNVVCGAKNIAPGQKVPLARVGATLPGGITLKPTKIRGVESEGMMCSARELGLAEDAEGILILPADAPVGDDFSVYAGLPDTVFEPEITPNRVDLLSHFGIAREAAALFKRALRYPERPAVKESASLAARHATVTLEAPDLCRLYTARVLTGLKVGPSPAWLRDRLERVGARSINNVVDVTNFILFELGQPLHAFDLARLTGSKVVIRRARDGERVPLLDGTERELKDPMLVIADAERPVALAGVMGGSNSEVSESTTSLLLESAWFLPGSVRRTARTLGVSTDSSYRFERGVDPVMVRRALDRAAALIQEVAGGEICQGVLETSGQPFRWEPIPYRPRRADALLGCRVPLEEQSDILRRLGCREEKAGDLLRVIPPSWRVDLAREVDLVEEIARMAGYDLIPTVGPRIPVTPRIPDPLEETLQRVRSVFLQAGLHEAVGSTFLAPDFADRLRLPESHPFRKAPMLMNPTAEDQKVMRPSLLPSLLSDAQVNFHRQQESAHFFETDKVFWGHEGGKPAERMQAAALLSGEAAGTSWARNRRRVDYADIKGLAEAIANAFGWPGVHWTHGNECLPYRSGVNFRLLSPRGDLLLKGGALDPRVLKNHDLDGIPCFALEADLETLSSLPRPVAAFAPLPKFPSSWRDLALVVPDTVAHEQVTEVLRAQGGPELRELTLFDLYRGPHVPEGHRSLAWRLSFRHDERTMTDEEVSGRMKSILETLKARYSIVPR
jgi:phenylalanyl-tRNA synthetase beta chain